MYSYVFDKRNRNLIVCTHNKIPIFFICMLNIVQENNMFIGKTKTKKHS